MSQPAEPSAAEQVLAGFSFPNDEPAHVDRVLAAYPELVRALGRIMAAIYQGIGLLEGIPVFALQDKRTLLVALVNRSFKCLNVAITSGLRGYYVQAVILVRSVHEDNLLFADLDTNAATVQALYAGDQKWFLRGEGRWRQMAERLDQLAAQQGFGGHAGQGWIELYALESVLAHPRLPALQAEFSRDGTRLIAAPEWDADLCRRALGGALTSGRLALAMERSVIPVIDRTRGWHVLSASIAREANDWIRAEIQRIKAESSSDLTEPSK